MRVGFDLGGVLRVSGEKDPMPGVIQVLVRLRIAGAERFVISKRPENNYDEGRQWIQQRLGGLIPAEHVRFCSNHRREKTPIAAELSLTHFVDDRLEVLSFMHGTVPHLYWFQPTPEKMGKYQSFLPHVHPVENWPSLLPLILTTV